MEMNTSCTEVQPEKISDLDQLSRSISSLKETLRTFSNEFGLLENNVFDSERVLDSDDSKRESPENIIVSLSQTIEDCFDIQREIRDKFNRFYSLLLTKQNG